MKKSKFIKSTIILMIGGLLTKLLGMIIKIVQTRLLGTEGVGIYMLIMPTFSLLVALAQLGLPVAISTLVARDNRNNKKLVFSVIPISLMINGIIMIFVFLFSSYLANNLLHEPRSYYALLGMGFVLPFISISSIIRGYFFGKERMIPHVISNIVEDVIRLIILAIGIPIFLVSGLEFAVAFIILSNIVSELTSILILFFFLPKKFHISKRDFVPEKESVKEVLGISLPTTGSRLIGNIGYFFEPIILTYVLLKVGYTNRFIVTEYGILNGYVMPMLMLPSFFTAAISQALIPVISNAYIKRHMRYARDKIKQAIFFSLMIGIPATIFFFCFPSLPLKLLYNTTEGVHYLRLLAPLFLIYYIQSPLTSALQATGKAGTAMQGTIIGVFIRTFLLFSLSHLKIGMWGLLIATMSNVFFVTFHHAYYLNKYLK